MFNNFKEMLKSLNTHFIEVNENEIAIPVPCFMTDDAYKRSKDNNFLGKFYYPFAVDDKDAPDFNVYSDEEFIHIRVDEYGFLNWHIIIGESEDYLI